MAVSDASVTTTTGAAFIPELWADGVLSAAEFAAMIQKRVTRDFEGVIKNMGSIVDVPRLSNLTTQSKSTGVSNTINFEAIAEGKQQVTVATQEYAAFLLEDAADVQSKFDLASLYEKKIGYALARGRDVALAAQFTNFTTNVVGSSGVELTADDYLTAWQKLAESGLLQNDPDPGEDFSMFISPAAYAAAMKVDVFINREQYQPNADAIERAHLGDIYGQPVYISNLLRSPAAGAHDCISMHRGALALCVQAEIPVKSQYLIRNIADGVVGWNLYGLSRMLYPPETPGGATAVDNRGVFLRTI